MLLGQLGQLVEGQAHENADALIEHAEAVGEGERLLGFGSLAPWRDPAGPNERSWAGPADRANLLRRVVADGEDEIELGRLGTGEFVPGLGA